MLNSPEWFNLAHTSSRVTYSNIRISAISTSSARIANTDGWDIYRSDQVVIRDSVINNGDDCVSFKPSMCRRLCRPDPWLLVEYIYRRLYEYLSVKLALQRIPVRHLFLKKNIENCIRKRLTPLPSYSPTHRSHTHVLALQSVIGDGIPQFQWDICWFSWPIRWSV